MKITPFFVITVCLGVLVSPLARAQDTVANVGVPVTSTPANLARQISGADHVVIRYQFVTHPPQLTNFSLSISGDRLAKIVGVVSSGTRHYGTTSFWGWEMQFCRGTNCLATVPFSDDFYVVAGHGGGEYIDETGTLKKLYRGILDKAHVDKKEYGQIYGALISTMPRTVCSTTTKSGWKNWLRMLPPKIAVTTSPARTTPTRI